MAPGPLGSTDVHPPPGFPPVLSWVTLPLAPYPWCSHFTSLPTHIPILSAPCIQSSPCTLQISEHSQTYYSLKLSKVSLPYILEASSACIQSTCLSFDLTFICDYLLNSACPSSLKEVGQDVLIILSPKMCKIPCSLHWLENGWA